MAPRQNRWLKLLARCKRLLTQQNKPKVNININFLV